MDQRISSKLDEKQQLLGFFCSNLQLDHEKLDVELKIPFNMLTKVQNQHIIWRTSLTRSGTGKSLMPFA
jgi:hypothetical protein